MSQVPCLHGRLANAARVTYPPALQRCKLDVPLLAAGLLTTAYRAKWSVFPDLQPPESEWVQRKYW